MAPDVPPSLQDLVKSISSSKKIEFSEILSVQVIIKLLAIGGIDLSTFQFTEVYRKIFSVLQLPSYRDSDKKLLFCQATCHNTHAGSGMSALLLLHSFFYLYCFGGLLTELRYSKIFNQRPVNWGITDNPSCERA